ncbi:MAG: helix-turn-helix domain-containing protein, partial [Acidimicrobiia bacterium]
GNVRELENFIERIVTVAPPDALSIDPSFFPIEIQKELENFRLKINASIRATPLKEQISNYEAEIVKKTLIECGWNQSKAARKLHTSESNIRYKMDQLNIQRDDHE